MTLKTIFDILFTLVSILAIMLETLLDFLFIFVSILAIILGGVWGYYKWQNEQKRMREEEGLYDPRFNIFIQIKKHKGMSDETKLVEIRGLLKNIGKIPIQLNYDKSCINIYQISEEYEEDSVLLNLIRKEVKFTNESGYVFLDTGITYPIPTTICDLPEKVNLYFNIIFDIDSHKETFSRKEALFPKGEGEEQKSLVYNITLLLPEDDSEVSHGSL